MAQPLPSVIGPPAALLNVPQPLPEKRKHVLVIEGVENHPALSA
jgi:hypothetical protein